MRDHMFVRSTDPHFGSEFGGACDHQVDGVTCGWPESVHPSIVWNQVHEERYCVDSGRPVQLIPGDRCRSHGNRGAMCTTAVRDPRCKHPRLSTNHPYPKCEECGLAGQVATSSQLNPSGGGPHAS